jgi:hypothetical protein
MGRCSQSAYQLLNGQYSTLGEISHSKVKRSRRAQLANEVFEQTQFRAHYWKKKFSDTLPPLDEKIGAGQYSIPKLAEALNTTARWAYEWAKKRRLQRDEFGWWIVP